MKLIKRVFIAFLFITGLMQIAFSQSPLSAGEYFIDTDPGEGNGVPLTSSDGNFDELFEELNITIPTSSLSEGVHTLFVRLKNRDGSWGKVIAKTFVVRDASAFYVHLPPKLTNAEYFVDNDPGEGNGTALNAVDGNIDGAFENVLGTLNTSSLTEGAHTLFVRFKNSEGNWGKAIAKPFIVRDESAFFVYLPPKLTNAEYYVDTDPGQGNGTALNAVDGNINGAFENVLGILNTSSLTDGAHTLFVRFKNSEGTWGKVIAKPFIVRDESAFFVYLPPKLTNAEYFVDNDPGEGNGTALNALDGNIDGAFENVLGTLNTSSLTEGAHTLFVRFKNSEGNWGKVIAKPFVVKNELAFAVNMPSKIISAEYFIDSDTAKSISLKSSDGSFDQFFENVCDTIKTGLLTEDIHSVGMRFLESNGIWSKPFYSIIEIKNITPPSQPTGFTAIARNRKAILKWFKNLDHDIAGYSLYRSLINNFEPDSTNLLTTVSKNDTLYVDKNLENGINYYYRLKAIDVANLYSEPSDQIEAIPFNTAPYTFALQSPANGDTLANVTQPVKFIWQASADIDEDTLYYTLWIRGANIDTSISSISDTSFDFNGSGLFLKNSTYIWSVKVNDGTDWTASVDTFIFITPDFVGVNDNNNATPKQFVLYQNYPNPFNPTTTIRFDLPEQSRVVLKIYNILGHEIKTLLNGILESGTHLCVWNGKNQSGLDVPSGIYLYRIETDNFKKTMKLLLLR